MSRALSWVGILPFAVAFIVLGTQVPEAASAQGPTPTRTPTGFIIILPPSATPTPPVIIILPTPTLPSSGPPTLTPTSTRTSTATLSPTPPSFTLPSPTPTSKDVVAPSKPTPTPHWDPVDIPFPLTMPSLTPTPGDLIGPQPPEILDLSLTHLEVTQGMQDLDNDMPLVRGRVTYVRAYVRSFGGGWFPVTGILEAWRGGQYLGMRPPENGPIPAFSSGGDRTNTDHTLNFLLPYDWRTGDVTLRGFIYSADPQAPFEDEPIWVNNFRKVEVEFHPGDGVNLSLWPVHLHQNYDPALPEITYNFGEPTLWEILAGMKRLLPIPEVYVFAPPVAKLYCMGSVGGEVGVGLEGNLDEHGSCEFNLMVPGGAFYLNQVMDWVHLLTSQSNDVYNYAMIPPEFAGQMFFDNADGALVPYGGLAFSNQTQGLMSTTTWATSPWQHAGGSTMGHEIGHRLGLGHANCLGTEELGGGLDGGFPWVAPACSLANVHPSGFFGFDVYHSEFPGMPAPVAISNDPTVAEPNLAFPLMGYVAPWWLDPYHYCTLLEVQGVPCDKTVVPFLASGNAGRWMRLAGNRAAEISKGSWGNLEGKDLRQPASQANAEPILWASGSIDGPRGQASFVRIMVLSDAAREPLDEGPALFRRTTPYSLALVNASGEVVGLEPIYDTSVAHGMLGRMPFLIGLPFDEAAVAVQIRQADVVLAEHRLSARPPTVRLLSPNGGEILNGPPEISWEARDPDGDRLDFTIQYSADGGLTWQALIVGHRGRSLQLESIETLAGTDMGMFRVIASDGVRSAQDESDGVFSVPNTAPMPAITSPSHLAVFPVGGTVLLSGSATDLEDGILASDSLVWESDRDGALGVGPELALRGLSAGTHVITLRARDSEGVEGVARVAFGIDPAVVIRQASPAELELVASTLAEFGARGPGIPEDSGSDPSRPDWLPLVIVGLVAIAFLVGAMLALLLLRSFRR